MIPLVFVNKIHNIKIAKLSTTTFSPCLLMVLLTYVPMLPELISLISDISINLNEVFEVLNVRVDNIGPSVLKNCAASMVQPLHFLFSLL